MASDSFGLSTIGASREKQNYKKKQHNPLLQKGLSAKDADNLKAGFEICVISRTSDEPLPTMLHDCFNAEVVNESFLNSIQEKGFNELYFHQNSLITQEYISPDKGIADGSFS